MTTAKRDLVSVWRILSIAWAASIATACGGGDGTPRAAAAAAAAGPAAIDVVRVVEQSLDVPLSLPGELTAFQSVAIFPRVTGFVKTVNVDRGSRVRAGDVLASLEAPELVAQRAEAQSKLQGAEAQLSVARAKADADKSTFARLKAASATPGVVAGNDVVIAEKTADASGDQVLAAEQSVEAARQALTAIRDMEGYLRVTAPFAGVITERNVHPGALVGPSTSSAGATPLLRLVDTSRLRLVVPVPEAYTAEMKSGTEIGFTVAAYPDGISPARLRASLRLWTSARERWPSSWTWPTAIATWRLVRFVRCDGRSGARCRHSSCPARASRRRRTEHL